MRPMINDNRPMSPAETADAARRARSIAGSVTLAVRRFVNRRSRRRAVTANELTPSMRRDLGLPPSWADVFPNVRSSMGPLDQMLFGSVNDNSFPWRRAV